MNAQNTLDREGLKKAIAEGKTPQELQEAYGFSTAQKLYAAIRSLYEQPARAEKRIMELKANRRDAKKSKREEPKNAPGTVAPVNTNQPVSAASESDVSTPTEVSGTAAPVTGTPSTRTLLEEVCKDLVAAKEHGCIVAVDYILNHGDNLKYIPKEKLVIPRQVLNILLSIAKSKPIEERRKIRQMVSWAEKNATIIDRISDYRDGPLAQKAAKELAAIKKNNQIFCFAVLHARRMCGLPEAVPLTTSREIRSVLSVWGM